MLASIGGRPLISLHAGARSRARLLAALALLLPLGSGAAAQSCTGDCNGDGEVTIDETVTAVNIGLARLTLDHCLAADRNGDGEVSIDEVLAAVNAGLSSCPIVSAETRCAVPSGTGVNFDPDQPFCDFLSSYRFFRGNGSTQQPNDGVLPYDLNTPLFSDYAFKHRFVWMPSGSGATYTDSGSFDFPVGAVIIKTFAFPFDFRHPEDGERVIETRLLAHRPSGWDVVTYVWNDAQTVATRTVIGATTNVQWTHFDGTQRRVDYHVPNTNQCKECHREHDGLLGPLGPQSRNLNKDYAYADGPQNELVRWGEVGYLLDAPNPADVPRAPVFDDPSTGTLEERAREYLDVNCGNCHNPSGLARTSGLYLNIEETTPVHYGVCKIPVAAGQGSGGRAFDIVPGKPDESILIFRMESTVPGIAMPELGRQTVHQEALAVLRAWIESLPGACR